VWEELAQLKSRGVTILMSTHYMDEAATLCDRVALMDRGRILALAPPPVLVERHAGRSVAELRLDGASRESVRKALSEAGVEWREVGALFRLAGDGANVPKLEGLSGVRVDLRSATLEDVFMRLTGKELVDE
jgi:lipooligosaccharide transport system ATP-binding protein